MPRLSELALRVLVACVAASALGLAFGRELVAASLPVLEVVTAAVWPEFVGRFELVDAAPGASLRLSVMTIDEIPLDRRDYVPRMTRFDPATTSLVHVVLPVAILVAALAAWPLAGRRDLVVRLVLALPLALLVLALTAPFSLVGLVEIALTELKRTRDATAAEPWEVTYLVFLESGGRWLLPLVAAAAAIRAGWRRTPAC